MNAVPNGFESSPLTTRIAVVDKVAAEWLTSHPEIPVTAANLSKTLQQMLTEVFLTGQQRSRCTLSVYAESLIHAAAVDAKEVASARTFSKSADLPACSLSRHSCCRSDAVARPRRRLPLPVPLRSSRLPNSSPSTTWRRTPASKSACRAAVRAPASAR